MKRIFVHPEKCMGCGTCRLACAVEHSEGKTLFSAISETPAPAYRLYVERAGEGDLNIPLTCRHCDDAPCLDACIAGAIERDENGVVRHLPDRCIGCLSCLMVCPFGVISRDRERKSIAKCDLCPGLDAPACVSSCPTGALSFEEAEEYGYDVRVRAAGILADAVTAGTIGKVEA